MRNDSFTYTEQPLALSGDTTHPNSLVVGYKDPMCSRRAD